MNEFKADPKGQLHKAIAEPDQRLAFFVGAGVSINSGLPDFVCFNKRLIRSIGPKDWDSMDITEICRRDDSSSKMSEIDEICNCLRPEVLIQEVLRIHGDNTLEFYKWLEGGIPNSNHYYLALALKKGHCVFTTNVDTFIEQACNELNVSYKPVVFENEYKALVDNISDNNSPIDFDSCLFKLHGSISRESSCLGLNRYKSIQFALNQVGKGLNAFSKKVLTDCLLARDFIFLGYSGNDHFSVQPVLKNTGTGQTDRKIYWFKYRKSPSELEVDDDIGGFLVQKNKLWDRATDGKEVESTIWEDVSVLEVLAQRDTAYLIKGDSSATLKEIMKQMAYAKVIPEALELKKTLDKIQEKRKDSGVSTICEPRWVKGISDFNRCLCAAALLIRVRDLDSAMPHLKEAKRCATADDERAKVERLFAVIDSIKRPTGKKPSTDDLRKTIDACKEKGALVPMIEACLEMANLCRIARSFDKANEILDGVEAELNQPNLKKLDMLFDDKSRLMAQLLHYRGLICGLGLSGDISNKLEGLYYCKSALEFADLVGDISRKAAVLNGRGLIMYQLAEKMDDPLQVAESSSNGQPTENADYWLQEAESSLNESLALYARIRDPRSSFQPLRNLMLVHLLRAQNSQPNDRERWYELALKDCDRGERYLAQVHTDSNEPSGDQIELCYRRACILSKLGKTDEACSLFKTVLSHWEAKNDKHQQARIWQELLEIEKDEVMIQECTNKLLGIVSDILHSPEERKRYFKDRLRLQNHYEMLYKISVAARRTEDRDCLCRIADLAELGQIISEELVDENKLRKFTILAEDLLGEKP